jgi:hypothetical protein
MDSSYDGSSTWTGTIDSLRSMFPLNNQTSMINVVTVKNNTQEELTAYNESLRCHLKNEIFERVQSDKDRIASVKTVDKIQPGDVLALRKCFFFTYEPGSELIRQSNIANVDEAFESMWLIMITKKYKHKVGEPRVSKAQKRWEYVLLGEDTNVSACARSAEKSTITYHDLVSYRAMLILRG